MRTAGAKLFCDLDCVVSPVSPVVNFPAEFASPINDPEKPFEHICYTVPWNMSENPALSINGGYDSKGIPSGRHDNGPRPPDLRRAARGSRLRGLRRPPNDLPSGAGAFDRDVRRGPVKRLADGKVDYSDAGERDGGGQVTLRIFKCLKPVIAAVNGPAVGIGVTMQLAMDIRIASVDARFGFVFSQRGIVPEAASSWFLPRIVGISQALEWCYTGRVFPAQEALAGRLVSKVVPADELLTPAPPRGREIASKTAPVSISP